MRKTPSYLEGIEVIREPYKKIINERPETYNAEGLLIPELIDK